MKTLRQILPYMRPHWKLAFGTCVLTLLGALSMILSPWPLKLLVDSVLGNEPLPSPIAGILGPIAGDRYALLIFAVLAGFVLTVMVNGLAVVEDYVSTGLDQRMVLDFRSDLFRHAQQVSSIFHDQRRTGDFMFRINSAAGSVGKITVTIPDIIRNIVTLVGMFVVVMLIDYELALLSLAVVPFLYYSVNSYATRVQPRLRQVRRMEGKSFSIIHEAMSMLRVIVAFNREDHEYRKFRDHGERAVDARINLTVRQTLFSLAVNGITAAGLAAILGLGAHHVIQGDLTIGELLVIAKYIESVYQPLESVSKTVGSLQEQIVSLNAATALLHAPIEVTEDPDAIELPEVRGDIAYRNVDFAYGEHSNTLHDISFDIEAGQVVAVVGPTGAGKTTLVSLLTRFFDPDEGQILIDGVDTRKLTLASLRRNVSVVMQEPLLFADTIGKNIRYGRLDATRNEVVRAARNANAHQFIINKDKKYATQLGERGAQLSGGERQRLSIARAFLKDAPILILDEPTSSIDTKTESVILDSLQRLMQGRTTIMIAHRLSTIRNADLILVMDEGCLVEQGTHDELMARDGLYRQLYDIQVHGYDTKQPQAADEEPLAETGAAEAGLDESLLDVIPDRQAASRSANGSERGAVQRAQEVQPGTSQGEGSK